MYNEKSNKIRWIAVFTAIVLILAGVVTSLAIAIQNKPVEAKANDTVSDVIEQPAEIPSDNENPGLVSLRMSPSYAVAAANGQQTVSKTITATVMPVDAPDKSVDWSIKWCTPIEGKDISEYLTLTPESDGALTATITALKGFEGGSAYVTATTRVGGFTATCLIMYDGKPESLSFIHNGKEITNTGTVNLTAGTTNEITLNLKNTLGAVGSKYGDFEIVKVKGQGRFTMKKEYIVNGSVRSTEEIVFNLEEGVYKYKDEVLGTDLTLTITPEDFFTASISGNKLTVKANRSESSYSNGYPRTGYRFTYKGTYTDPRAGGKPDNCIWYVLVRDKVSGEESLLHIDIQSTVTSISLSDTVYSF